VPNVVDHLPDTDDVAIIDPKGQQLTYRELKVEVGRVAGGMKRLGLGEGDRLVLLVPMSIDLYITLLAIFHLGATATLVDPGSDLQGTLSRHPPDGLIGVPKAHLLRLKIPALRGLKAYVSTGFTPLPHRRLSGLRGDVPPVSAGDAPALLTFTSGTTGIPKAIGRSHDFLLGQHRVLSEHMSFESGDVDLPTLPVFLLHSLASGATCVIADADLRAVGEVDPGPVIAQLAAHNVTSTSGSPAFYRQVVDHLLETGAALPHLRDIYTGGARVPAQLVDDLAQALPGVQLHVVYGSTEAEPIAVLDASANRDELRTETTQGALVGTPVQAIQIRIDGEPFGEILVAGPHVNTGYLDNPEADAIHKVREGDTIWHRTGDVGRLDEDGRLWLVGRVGESVAGLWPLAVEGPAEALAFVRKAGLVSIGGEPVLAVELIDPPPDWEQILHSCTGAKPRAVDAIPVDRRHNAKVDRLILTRLLEGAE